MANLVSLLKHGLLWFISLFTRTTYYSRKQGPWYQTWVFALLGALFFLYTLHRSNLHSYPVQVQTVHEIQEAVPSQHKQLLSNTNLTDPAIVDKLFPISEDDQQEPHLRENRKSLHTLVSCIASRTCTQNQTGIVILASEYFNPSPVRVPGGERIWASSVADALHSLGYTLFYISGQGGNANKTAEAKALFNQFPALVKAVLLDGDGPEWCARRQDCIYSPEHPTGLPIHNLLSFHFWADHQHPLGGQWTLSPYDWGRIQPRTEGRDNIYLGYSIEKTCKTASAFVPHEQRENRGFVLGKFLRFFTADSYAWTDAEFDALGLPVVGGITDRNEGYDFADLPNSITNLGVKSEHEFYAEVAKSKVLIGVGESKLSPSPYQALCLGVPFINPVLYWDTRHPEDRSRWFTQHDGLKLLREPYVYHVKKGDLKGLGKALRKAATTPIKSFVPEDMTFEALKHRVGEIIERDWYSLTLERLKELGWDVEEEDEI